MTLSSSAGWASASAQRARNCKITARREAQTFDSDVALPADATYNSFSAVQRVNWAIIVVGAQKNKMNIHLTLKLIRIGKYFGENFRVKEDSLLRTLSDLLNKKWDWYQSGATSRLESFFLPCCVARVSLPCLKPFRPRYVYKYS